MPKIEKYVTESLGAEVLVRSTNQPQTSYAAAASLSEFKLNKILIDKIEANKSIDILDFQKNLYNALVESYNNDNDIIGAGTDNQEKDEKQSQNDKTRLGMEKTVKDKAKSKPESQSSQKVNRKAYFMSFPLLSKLLNLVLASQVFKEPSHTVEESGMQQDQEFIIGDNVEQPADKDVTKADWFKKPERPPTLDPDWSKRQQVNF
ncbi:hypothetical protein Tco_0606715 [Tanacetum coccineum]